MTAVLQDYRPIFIFVAFVFLGFAFYISYQPRRAATGGGAVTSPRSRIITFNRVVLWSVTVIAIVLLFFPQAVTNLFASVEPFTADMDRTVIAVEGMT